MSLTKQTGIINIALFTFIVIATELFLNHRLDKRIAKYIIAVVVASGIVYLSWDIYLQVTSGENIGFVGLALKVLKHGTVGYVLFALGFAVIAIAIGAMHLAVLKGLYRLPVYLLLGVYFTALTAVIIFYDSDAGKKKDAVVLTIKSFIGHDSTTFGNEVTSSALLFGHSFRIVIALFLLLVVCLWKWMTSKKNCHSEIASAYGMKMIQFAIVAYLMYQYFRLAGYCYAQTYKVASVAIEPRYIAAFWCMLLILSWDFAFRNLKLEEQLYKMVVIVLSVFLLIFFDCSTIFTEMLDKNVEHEFIALEGVTFEFGDKIYLMDTNLSNAKSSDDFYYEVAPASSTAGTWYVDEFGGDKYTVEEVQNQLSDGGFNYIYIENIGDDFQEYYADLFDNPDDFAPNHIYRVFSQDDGTIKLELYR
ncbi:MAG: hypothetical protein K6A23_14650 [Butyrivibrio sp.]|nr:hypothetical protein [Butyrivibrio sp.]